MSGTLPIACLALFLALVFASGTVNAEMHELVVQVDQTLTINVPDRLSFTVNNIDDEWHIIPFQIGISTNNRTGYTLVSEVPNVLRNSVYTDATIKLGEHWEIAYPEGTKRETATHSVYPNSDNTALDRKYDYELRVLADSHIVNGSYSGAMNFYATANPYPDTIAYIDYMQQITNDIVLSMTPGKYYQLKDSRDGKKYWIVFQDGELRMAQNLDYDIDNTVALTNKQSNVSSNIILNNSTITGGTFADSWVESTTAPQSYDEGVVYRMSDEDIYSTINSCARDGYTEWECYRNAVGNSYNWSAAVASNNTDGLSANYVAEESICPARWQLPVTADEGFLSATLPSDKAAAGKIRCEGIKPEHVVTFNTNDYYGTTETEAKKHSAWGIASFVLPKDFEYGLDNSHELAGWSTNQNDTFPEYDKNSLFSTEGEYVKLYAVWRDKDYTLDDITYMQEITPTIIKNTPHGKSKQLIDQRDSKKYWVTKFGGESGDIWMTQNLDFDMRSTSRYDNRTTDILADTPSYSYSFYSSAYDFDPGEYYFANGTDKTSATGLAEDDIRWHYHIGNYYSVYNAKFGVYSADKYENTKYSVCPKGWGIPTVHEAESFSYNNSEYNSLKYPVKGGYLTTKDVVIEQGTTARYITNTWYYYYYVRYTDLISGVSNYSQYNAIYYAGSLRCIARKDYNVNDPFSNNRLTLRQGYGTTEPNY